MHSTGHELVQDSATVSNAGLRNRASVTTQDSPIPNKFTQAPSEYRDSYETTSIVFLLSHAVSDRDRGAASRPCC